MRRGEGGEEGKEMDEGQGRRSEVDGWGGKGSGEESWAQHLPTSCSQRRRPHSAPT